MSLTLDDQTRGDTLVVSLSGRLDTLAAKIFEYHLVKRLAAGVRRLVIDLSGVDYVSSYGLRVFLITAKTLRADPDAFALCGLRPEVLNVFQISGFDKILTIRSSVAEKLAQGGSAA